MEIYLFIGISLIATASPGPAVLKAIYNGSVHGFKIALIGILGNLCAVFSIALLSFFGIGAIIEQSILAFTLLKYLGSSYLIYLGLKMLLTSSSMTFTEQSNSPPPRHRKQIFFSSFLVGISNPKALIFFTALFPQFINNNAALAPQFLTFSALFLCCSLGSLSTYAFAASFMAAKFQKESIQRRINSIFGGMMIGFGAALGLSAKTS